MTDGPLPADEDPWEAAEAWNRAAIAYFGEAFAFQNVRQTPRREEV